MKDFIVIGSGIGSFSICKRLRENKKTFTVVSNFNGSATSVAGGIINPIVLKKFKLFWNAIEFYNEAVSFYKKLHHDTHSNFLAKKDIIRAFSSVEEQNEWFIAADKPVLSDFLNTNIIGNDSKLNSQFKLGLMNKAYLVDAKNILNYFHNKFLASDQLKNDEFDYSKLTFFDSHFEYKNIPAENVVFTEGSRTIYNPFFSYLPLYGNRGDYLIFKSEELNINELVKGKNFIIPLGNDLYKFGASFDRHNLINTTPQSYRDQLINSLQKTINVGFEVVRFESGVRPNVKDRRPVLGEHPVHKNMYIMNGFGSRGMFMSPLLSKWLYWHIESGQQMNSEVDIKRFHGHF